VITNLILVAYHQIYRKGFSPTPPPKIEEQEGPMKHFLETLATEDSGQDLIEYALVAALVGLGAVVAMKGLSNSIKNSYNGVGTSLTNA
jgi:pilus assembly protein Flp/PilA